MSLRLHNTLSGKKEPFEPRNPGHARIYVCGPTVYDAPHLGHLRCYVVYDVLIRHLRNSGVKVTYVRNVTDIDDRIMERAQERGTMPEKIAQHYTQLYHEAMAQVGNLPPDTEPRVSDHIEEIGALVQRLLEKGVAYQSNGDVYFEVSKFPEYGKLSHRRLDELVSGASGRTRTQESERKRSPADFALWKAAEEGSHGWKQPWSFGRPGWHIECSAMSMKYLGESFDLHGGGLDLVFPHHENELAQSCAATGKPLASMWVHNGFVEVNKEKMSKSLGNFFTSDQITQRCEPEAIRYWLMTVHYRSPLNFEWESTEGDAPRFPQLAEAERRVQYFYATRRRLEAIPPERLVETEQDIAPEIRDLKASVVRALDDDLNMPVALAAVAAFLRAVNELCDQATRKKGKASRLASAAATEGFDFLRDVLGLGFQDPSTVLARIRDRRARERGIDPGRVEELIQQRIEARRDKAFDKADALRQELTEMGVELQDSPHGTTWSL